MNNAELKLEPLRAEHVLALMDLQDAQAGAIGMIRAEHAVALEDCGGGWTGLVDGRPVGAAGVADLGFGRGLAWMLLSRRWRAVANSVFVATEHYLEKAPYRRIEAAVRVQHASGHRWLMRLGFALECPRMRAWGPDGDYALYARVR